jgi:hypothetical protein
MIKLKDNTHALTQESGSFILRQKIIIIIIIHNIHFDKITNSNKREVENEANYYAALNNSC